MTRPHGDHCAIYALMQPGSGNPDQLELMGTGFMIHSTGLLLTAAHVLDGLHVPFFRIELRSDPCPCHSVEVAASRIVQVWNQFDLALVQCQTKPRTSDTDGLDNGKHLYALNMCYSELETGSSVRAVGYPQAYPSGDEGESTLKPPIDRSIVSKKTNVLCRLTEPHKAHHPPLYVLDDVLREGMSGGPIIEAESELCFAVAVQRARVPGLYNCEHQEEPGHYGIAVSLELVRDDLIAHLAYADS